MSLERAEQKEKSVQEAILDVLAYFAVFGLRLDFDTLYSYLQVKSGELMVKKQLMALIEKRKISLVKGSYGLKKIKYPASVGRRKSQNRLIKKARLWGRAIGLLPFVKSVAIINSVAYGNVHEESDIDLIIVTTPGRIFITKGVLMYSLKMLRQLEDQYSSAGRFSLGMFLTTRSVKLDKDIMVINEPDLVYRMITCKPVYGADVWYNLLKSDAYLYQRLPNYTWPKIDSKIHTSSSKLLDRLDDFGYKRHLKHTASQAKSHHPEAHIRLRPDIINLHHKDKVPEITEKWRKIRASI